MSVDGGVTLHTAVVELSQLVLTQAAEQWAHFATLSSVESSVSSVQNRFNSSVTLMKALPLKYILSIGLLNLG